MINFLDELGNFKQKNVYTSKCKFFLHFTTTDPLSNLQILLNKVLMWRFNQERRFNDADTVCIDVCIIDEYGPLF